MARGPDTRPINRGALTLLASVCAVSAVLAAAQAAPAQLPVPGPPEPMRVALETLRAAEPYRIDQFDLERFYELRGFMPAWQSAAGREAADVLLTRMARAADDGLPALYDAGRWSARLRSSRAPDTDIRVTAALLRFGRHLAFGAAGAHGSARTIDVVSVLASARDGAEARRALNRLAPSHAEYHALREALRTYASLSTPEGWRPLPPGTLLKPADSPAAGGPPDPDILRSLCQRLALTGDLAATGCEPTGVGSAGYTPTLQQGVRRFQMRHGLMVDGVVGPRTVAALNVPVEARASQLALNMDRWRRQPDALGDPHLRVNIAGFRLHVHEGGRRVQTMRVVAGEPETPTPVLRDEITYLEFRPYWNVPRSITERELLPKIMRDPGYLEAEQFEVVDGWSDAVVVPPSEVDWARADVDFPYRLRQRPGPHNSLGLVKFMFPNEFSVYLHDTPATHRFEANRRAFSHGCVRVERPVDLAAFLLRHDPSWTPQSIAAAMRGSERRVVPLPEPVPVHLTYFTAWAEDGLAHFRADLYGLDDTEPRIWSGS